MISIKPVNNTKREAAHHSLQWNTVFISQVNQILLGSHLFSLQNLACSVVAFDTNQLGMRIRIREGVYIAKSPIWMIWGLISALRVRQHVAVYAIGYS